VAAEAMEQEHTLEEAVHTQAEEPDTGKGCCIYWVLSLQDDFPNEKLILQHYLEG
jgi:predicted ATP-grasp superfamily ATP-dependent carboligase